MLTSFQIRNFKSYEHARLPLAPLTVLIGANASGKSNALEALRLLSYIAQGNRLSAIRYAVYEGDAAVRGTMRSLGHRGQSNFSLGCTIDRHDWTNLLMELRLAEDDDLHIAGESIRGFESGAPLYEVVATSSSGSDIRVAYNNFAPGGRKPQIVCNDQLAVMSQLQSAARFGASHKAAQRRIPEICEYFIDNLAKVLFLDPQPAAMRGYSFKSEDTLTGDGRNISGVLWNLCSTEDTKNIVLDIIRSLPEQNIADITFIDGPRGEAMVQLTETFGGNPHDTDATLLSDGTLRVLSIAAALLSAPEGGLVVIEEIDNGVHPSRAEAILEHISRIALQRNLRVLISSHNPALLDALPTSAIGDVVFCYREPERGTSELVRLADLSRYPELVAQGPVGHLLTSGLLDRFVKVSESGVSLIARRRAWLNALRSGT